VMGDLAIRVHDLGKCYRIGHRRRYKSFGEALTATLCSPLKSARAHLSPVANSNGVHEHDDTLWAIKDVSFEVKCGEIIGIIGRNGSGKSTLLKILSRITAPTEGYAQIMGRVGSLLEVGTGFHGDLTGRENVYLNGAILGMKNAEIRRKFDEIVAFAETERFLDTPVKHYSSGMYLRLAFAVAAHLEPEILLVDEVLAVGDAAFQQKCLGKIGQVANEGRTVLFVSHNMGAMVQLCPRALLLSAGKIVLMDKTEAVVSSYLSESSPLIPDVSLDTSSNPNSPMVLTRCQIAAGNESPRSAISVASGFQVRLSVLARQEILGADICIRVSNMLGTPLFTANLSSSMKGLAKIKSGVHLFTVDVPGHFLAPDTYSLHVGIHRPNIELLDVHDAILTFTIEESGSAMWQYCGRDYGNILVDFLWSQEGEAVAPR